MVTDPIGDMLTRIRNANQALHERVEMPASGMKKEIARILQEEGYIDGYNVSQGRGARHAGRDPALRLQP